jgi:hypothetical protein
MLALRQISRAIQWHPQVQDSIKNRTRTFGGAIALTVRLPLLFDFIFVLACGQ